MCWIMTLLNDRSNCVTDIFCDAQSAAQISPSCVRIGSLQGSRTNPAHPQLLCMLSHDRSAGTAVGPANPGAVLAIAAQAPAPTFIPHLQRQESLLAGSTSSKTPMADKVEETKVS